MLWIWDAELLCRPAFFTHHEIARNCRLDRISECLGTGGTTLCDRALPRRFDPERLEFAGFTLSQGVFYHAIDTAAARAAANARAQLVEIGDFSSGQNFNMALLGVAHPTVQAQLARLALHKPAKANSLYTSLDKKMENQA